MSCGNNSCQWSWDGFVWTKILDNCPECCECPQPTPLSQGSPPVTSFTNCEYVCEEEDCENARIFSSIRTNKCCCPCAAYYERFARRNCSVCPSEKILGVRVTISGAEGKYEPDYAEWSWNSDDEIWEKTKPCPEHFDCLPPDPSPPKTEGEIRTTLCELIRGVGEEDVDYQIRRQAVRKNMCCDNLNGEYFIPIDRNANRRRRLAERQYNETRAGGDFDISHCGSQIHRLDAYNTSDPYKKISIGGNKFFGSGPGDKQPDPNYPIESVFNSIKTIKNSEDPDDENFCEVQIEWEIHTVSKTNDVNAGLYTCEDWPFTRGATIQGSVAGINNALMPEDWGVNDKYLKIYIYMSGNNSPNKFNYENFVKHRAEVAEKFPEVQPTDEYMDWNPDNEGLLPRAIYILGPLNIFKPDCDQGKTFVETFYPIHKPQGFSFTCEFGDETNIRGPWQFFNCNNCGPSSFQGASAFGYKHSRFSACCSPTHINYEPYLGKTLARAQMGDLLKCSNNSFKLDTDINKQELNKISIPSYVFMTFKIPWLGPFERGGAYIPFSPLGQLKNSVDWEDYKDWPFPTPFGVSQFRAAEESCEADNPTNQPIIFGMNEDYADLSQNTFLANFACGQNIKVEAEIIYENMLLSEKHLNDEEPYSLITPNAQAYGPNWKVCSGDWFYSFSSEPLRDKQGNIIYYKDDNGNEEFLRKTNELGDLNCPPTDPSCLNKRVNETSSNCFVKDTSGNNIRIAVSNGGGIGCIYTNSDNAKLILLKKYGNKSGLFSCLINAYTGTKHRIYMYLGDSENDCTSGDPFIVEIETFDFYTGLENNNVTAICRFWRGQYVESSENTFVVPLTTSGPNTGIPVSICINEEGLIVLDVVIERRIICNQSFSGVYFGIGSGPNNKNPIMFNAIDYIEHFDTNEDCPQCITEENCFPNYNGDNIFGYDITIEPLPSKPGGLWSSACTAGCAGFSIYIPFQSTVGNRNAHPCSSKKFQGNALYKWFSDNCKNDAIGPGGNEPLMPDPASISWQVDCSSCDSPNGKIILSISLFQGIPWGTDKSFTIVKEFPCNTDPNNLGFYNEPSIGNTSDDDFPCFISEDGVLITAMPRVRRACCDFEQE